MNRSPLFPSLPYLGVLARCMIGVSLALAALATLGGMLADLSLHGLLTLTGAVLALGGTGKFLLTARNNFPFYACGVAGWLIIAFV